MPPKTCSAPSKKVEQKKKEKIIEDKTFGLKNKKGAKQQKFIQQVQKQVKSGGNPEARKAEEQKKAEKEKKEQKQKELQELSQLFKPVAVQKAPKGVDPKSILCAYFKQGICVKGNKCKFSHDLQIERKAEKRNIYVDPRDLQDEESGISASDSGRSQVICKHFLEAVEKNKYGWFWECPNGGDKCPLRHALPEGYVLDKDKKKAGKDDGKDELTLEELVEKERAELGSLEQLTRVTLESFIAWKKRKISEKKEALKLAEDKKRSEFKAGRHLGLSGRDMFVFNPEMAANDICEDGDEAFDTRNLKTTDDYDDDDMEGGTDEDEETGQKNHAPVTVHEINLDSLMKEASDVDSSQNDQIMEQMRQRLRASKEAYKLNGISVSVVESEEAGKCSAAIGEATIADVPIDENLFAADDDELDELEANLEQLEVSS